MNGRKSGTRRALMVTYGGGHVAMIVPVAIEMRRRGWEVQVLALTTAESEMRKAGLECLTMRNFLRPEDKEASLWGARLAAGLSQSNTVPYKETVAYMGLSYADLVAELGEEKAARRYAVEGRQAFRPVGLMRRILAEINPIVVVATNSPRAERAAIEAADDLGIPSVCLVDLFALHEIQWIGKPSYAKKICVMSEYVRQEFINAGRSQNDLVVTGNPAFDRLAGLDSGKNRQEVRRRHAWAAAKVILWVSQPEPSRHPFSGKTGDPDLPRTIDRHLISLLGKRHDWRLVIRPHPSENLHYADLPDRVSLSGRGDDLAELLAGVDCVVVCSSTVGLEAALLGRPVVQIQQSIFSGDAPYARMGIAVSVENLDNLEAGIEQALSFPKRPAVALPAVGTAAAKVVDVIESVVI